jgi:hypothetical protein
MKVLFCNTGWMDKYDGLTNGDEINRIGASDSDELIEDILVIWLARHPEERQTRIVGWYKNAKVYRDLQKPRLPGKRNEVNYSYNIEALVSDCILIPPDKRSFTIPRGSESSGGIGQSNVWYCEGPKNQWIKKDALDFINQYEQRKLQNTGKRNKKVNLPLKLQVELNAIELLTKHYEEQGFIVTSVEKDNVGWDLEAKLDLLELKIEVKGLSSHLPIAHLTPNEYQSMKQNSSFYKLCIVTNALNPVDIKLSIFSFDDVSEVWIDVEGTSLKIDERTSARVSLTKKSSLSYFW